MLVPVVLACNVCVVIECLCEILHACWTHILEIILRKQIMELLPDWLGVWAGICLSQVHEVGVHIQWHHILCIELDHRECWVSVAAGGARCSDEVEADWRGGVDRLGDEEALVVGVAIAGESDNMLVSLHERFVPNTKLMKATPRRDVTDDVSEPS